MPEAPEQKARRQIDANLMAAGSLVQSRDELDLTAGRGVAAREFRMKSGFGSADYLLYLDCKAVDAVEAKAEGTLTGVEAQSAKYAAGLPDNLPAHKRPLPLLFESNGAVTYFTNGLDPIPRSREVFSFPRPETIAEWVAQPMQLRERLRELPALDEARLWNVQARAIRNLEASFADADPRALIQMATGSGKTFTAVNVAYRPAQHGAAALVERSGQPFGMAWVHFFDAALHTLLGDWTTVARKAEQTVAVSSEHGFAYWLTCGRIFLGVAEMQAHAGADPMLFPGITASTSPTDYFPLEQFQMSRFNGESWLPFGPILGR